ncbi:MAG: TolC family protein [Epsilonproteobacteria bacterium]|nr:TolC family protein [Campylobacterota bacterium]
MIKFLSIGLLVASLNVFASNYNILSGLKKSIISQDEKKNELNSDNLEKSWINSIKGSFSYSNSDAMSKNREETNTLSISINQPIFKSGGIYYAIKYANANRNFLRIITKNSEQTQIKTALLAILNIKKIDLQIQKQKLLIKNAKIDILRKKEQYKSGFLDSSYLNQAILSENSFQKGLIDMKSSKFDLIKTFKTYSDRDYKRVELPKFALLNESLFLKKSLAVLQKNSEIIKNNYLKKMTISSYLPTVSFTAGYYNIHDFGAKKYTAYGLNFTIPLFDLNRGRTIEIKKVEYLKSKLELQDTKRAEKENYDAVVNKIKLLKQKIAIAKSDMELYDSLLLSTEDSYKAGEKTIYDVDTLKNSKKTMSLDAKIFNIDIQASLLELYARMNGKI